MTEPAFAGIEVRPSRIEGNGVFATRAYAEGEVVMEVATLREVTEADPLPEGERADHCDYLADGTVYLIPEPVRYINHSCDPTTYKRYANGKRYTIARRDIAPGDEITHDYSINGQGEGSWQCSCGSGRCRGTIEHSFFRLPIDLQIEYLPCLTDVFRETFPEETARLNAIAMEQSE